MTTTAAEAIRTLFAPQSVAVIGASREPSSRSARLISNLRARFTGPVYPVNPNADEIMGLPAYPAAAAIGGQVDVAAVMVSAGRLLPALEQCAEAGVRAAVTFAASAEDPAPLSAAIKDLSLRTGMRVVGPNCLGVFSANSGVALTYTIVDTAPPDRPGTVAVLGQSGGVLHTIWSHGEELGIGHSHFISTGNEADLTFEDFLEYLIDDELAQIMCCYVEGIRNPDLLSRLALRARERGKSIVALKVGHSAASGRAAMSHTGALVGSMRHADAFLDRIGVLQAEGMTETAALASVLRAPLPRTDGVGILTTTGGMSAGLADLCGRNGVSVPSLATPTRRVIHDLLVPSGVINPDADNPVDLGAAAVDDRGVWRGALRALLADDQIGLVLATVAGAQSELAVESAALARAAGKPLVLYVYTHFGGAAAAGLGRLAEQGVPVYGNDSEAVRAVAAFLRYARRLRQPAVPPAGPGLAGGPAGRPSVLHEHRAKEWLSRWDIRAPRSVVSPDDDDQVRAAAAQVGYPVVVKVSDPRVVHKSEVGAVKTGLADERQLLAGVAQIRASLAAAGIDDPEGFLIEEHIEHPGLEWLVGIDNDAHFGPVLVFGLGGIAAEAIADVAAEPVPLLRDQAESLLSRGTAGRILAEGRFRGQPVDREALIDLLLRVSRVAASTHGRVLELDLNPVVTVPGRGALVLDARILLGGGTDHPADARIAAAAGARSDG